MTCIQQLWYIEPEPFLTSQLLPVPVQESPISTGISCTFSVYDLPQGFADEAVSIAHTLTFSIFNQLSALDPPVTEALSATGLTGLSFSTVTVLKVLDNPPTESLAGVTLSGLTYSSVETLKTVEPISETITSIGLSDLTFSTV
jgi:hypothetical protein